MSDLAILSAARAAIAAALPGVADWSDNPAPAPSDRLPAWAATLTREAAEPEAMGSPRFEVTFALAVDLFATYAPGADPAAAVLPLAEAAQAALVSDPGLAALVHHVAPSETEIETDSAERRLARASLRVSILATV